MSGWTSGKFQSDEYIWISGGTPTHRQTIASSLWLGGEPNRLPIGSQTENQVVIIQGSDGAWGLADKLNTETHETICEIIVL